MTLRDYQQTAVEAVRGHARSGDRSVLLVAPTGCVTGDALIGVNRAGKGSQMRLDHVVHMFNGGTAYASRWNLSLPTRVRAPFPDGTVRLCRVLDAKRSGVRDVFRLRLIDGRVVRLTQDHLVLTVDGWAACGRLRPGEEVCTDAGILSGYGKPKRWDRLRVCRKHPYAGRRGVAPGKGGWTVPEHRLIAEAMLNGMTLAEFVRAIEAGKEGLRFVSPKTHEVHHRDGNHKNNDPNNLQILTVEEHRQHHAKESPKYIRPRLRGVAVHSVSFAGQAETFDLEVEEANAFMANEIAVHNSGKTRMGAELARGCVRKGGRFLWLAPRAELVTQAVETLESLGVDTVCNGEVSTIQRLVASGARPAADLVVFDEAHHARATEWSKVLEPYAGAVLVGLTATPERGDGQGLGEMFHKLVVAATIGDLTAMGHLVPCRVIAPAERLDRGIAADPLQAYQEHAAGTQAIVFAQHVAHAAQIHASFLGAGIRAMILTDQTHWLERKNAVARFKDGDLRVLVNVNILTEGFDAPATQTCILARSCGSQGAFLQMVGRVLRPAPGKTEALLLDLRGSVHEHGMPDAPRVYSLDGAGITRAEPCAERYCRVCGCLMTGADCEECGIERKPVTMPVITGARLAEVGARIRDAFAERDAYWAMLTRTAEQRGFDRKWCSLRYKNRFNVWRAT